MSIEESIVRQAQRIQDPLSRRVFMKLAGAAGIALPASSALPIFGQAAYAATSGKAATQVATLANDYWAAFIKGFKATTVALKIDDEELYHDNDAAREISQVRGLSTSGVKMLINTVVAAGEVPMIAKLCQENKIYYSTIWEIPAWYTPSDVGDYFVAYMTSNSTQAGYEVAKELFKSIGGEGKVVHIKGLATPTDDARTAGVMKAAKEFPGITIVGDLRGDWVREKARTVMLSMVTAHPDMKAVFGQNDSMALGALSVLKERGLTNVKVAGIDGLSEGLQEVAKGGQFVATNTSMGPYQAGFATVLLFDALAAGSRNCPSACSIRDHSPRPRKTPPPSTRKFIKAKELPFDWEKMSRTLHPTDWDPQNKIVPIDPHAHWGADPTDQAKLNKAYADPNWKSEYDDVVKLYADHYKTGPFL